MSGNYVLDENGQPRLEPDFLAWGAWFATADRTVASTYQGDIHVSTVFLSLDHRFTCEPNALPVLYETMIFGLSEGHPLADYQERYTSREDALAGHEEACRLLRENQS